MKKFSKITGQQINEEPKTEVKIDEKQLTKLKIVNLMDRLLKIRSYGSVDNRFLSGSVKIEGKEMLAEAILDFLSDLSNKEQTKILEGLKSEVKDWEVIDKKIESLNKKETNISNKLKFNSFLERWSSDEETLFMIAELNSDKLNKETIKDYIHIINESNKLSNNLKIKLSNLYNNLI
jgi:hypothetical protein